MKQFDIRTDISGSRMVIYPAGTLAKRNTGAYVDAPYIEVQKRGTQWDYVELVRAGHVQKRASILTWNDPVEGTPRCHNLQELIDLMKEL